MTTALKVSGFGVQAAMRSSETVSSAGRNLPSSCCMLPLSLVSSEGKLARSSVMSCSVTTRFSLSTSVSPRMLAAPITSFLPAGVTASAMRHLISLKSFHSST